MQLKTGKQKLRLWPGKEADGSFPTNTPGKVPDYSNTDLRCFSDIISGIFFYSMYIVIGTQA